MKVGVVKELHPLEKRVALVPETCRTLHNKGLEIIVQSKAGEASGWTDADYEKCGAVIRFNRDEILGGSDCLLMVNGPTDGEENSSIASIKHGSVLITLLYPLSNLETVRLLNARNITTFALDLIPRISRAQSMDALSSMSTIAGYKSVLLAANTLMKFFPMLMTAAGTLPPARVFVIGAGVAGLQAIATAKRLGAIVEAFDVRPAVKEQVESLGAKFVGLGLTAEELEDASGYAKEVSADTHTKELELISSRLPHCDVVITTALIPGKPAPVLITKEMLHSMPKGSVIVDLAAVAGGNCEETKAGETVVYNGVTIIGAIDLPSQMATHSSVMFSKNISEFLMLLVKDGQIRFDFEDEIIRGAMITNEGKVLHEPTRVALEKVGTL